MMRWRTIASTALLALAAASCGGSSEPPPEGHHVLLTFRSIDPNVIDRVRVTFVPQNPGGEFMMVEPMTYADGAIEVTVESDGALVMTLQGAHVAALAQQQDATATYVYDLEIYTEDETVRAPPPNVTVSVDRAREVIASGRDFLNAWPPPLGESTIIDIPCSPATLDLCQ